MGAPSRERPYPRLRESPPAIRIYCATVSGMTPTPASALGRAGQFFEIREGDREVIVTEQGANLYRVRWAGTDLLDTVNDDGYTGGGGHGQLLLPWPGRVRNAVYQFEDEHYQLPINDLVHRSAIHGFTHWLAWEVKEHQENKLTLSCLLLAQPGYPFPLLFEQTYHLNGGVLEVSTMATNLGAPNGSYWLRRSSLFQNRYGDRGRLGIAGPSGQLFQDQRRPQPEAAGRAR